MAAPRRRYKRTRQEEKRVTEDAYGHLVLKGYSLIKAEIDSVRDGRGRRGPGAWLTLHDPVVLGYVACDDEFLGVSDRVAKRAKEKQTDARSELESQDPEYRSLCEEIKDLERTWRAPRAFAWEGWR